jgi:hypothetical protein
VPTEPNRPHVAKALELIGSARCGSGGRSKASSRAKSGPARSTPTRRGRRSGSTRDEDPSASARALNRGPSPTCDRTRTELPSLVRLARLPLVTRWNVVATVELVFRSSERIESGDTCGTRSIDPRRAHRLHDARNLRSGAPRPSTAAIALPIHRFADPPRRRTAIADPALPMERSPSADPSPPAGTASRYRSRCRGRPFSTPGSAGPFSKHGSGGRGTRPLL